MDRDCMRLPSFSPAPNRTECECLTPDTKGRTPPNGRTPAGRMQQNGRTPLAPLPLPPPKKREEGEKDIHAHTCIILWVMERKVFVADSPYQSPYAELLETTYSHR